MTPAEAVDFIAKEGEPVRRRACRFAFRLRAHGMGLILDVVPNHMGIAGAHNASWSDVLAWRRVLSARVLAAFPVAVLVRGA